MSPVAIITQTACAYGLAPAVLTSRSQARRVAEARAVAAWLAYELGSCSYAELGEVLRRDRTCVWHLVERTDRAIRDRMPLARRVSEVERSLQQLASAGHGTDNVSDPASEPRRFSAPGDARLVTEAGTHAANALR